MTNWKGVTPDFLTGAEKAAEATVHDFWRWAFSDLLSNATRGVFAEWLVATATGSAGSPREEWAPHDLIVDGVKVEVKSAAYVQRWTQTKRTPIRFSIAPTKSWDARTGEVGADMKRQADVYVFCLLDEREADEVNPLDLAQWKFFVVATKTLDACVPGQKSIGLGPLLKLSPPPAVVKLNALRDAIRVAVR